MNRTVKIILHLFIFILAVMTLFPLIWILLMSFKDTKDILMSSAFSLPKVWRFENYINAWVKGHIGEYFFNTVFVTAISTAFVILFGTSMGYAFSRLIWKNKNRVFTIVLLGLMIPVHATLIPLFVILKNMHVLNTHASLILPYIAAGLPMAVFIFRNFMIGIPKEMEEAACIDGCNVFQSFAYVIVPTIKPAVMTVIILTFMHYWNEYVVASVIIQKQTLNTLPIGLKAFQGEFTVDWGAMCAAIVVSSIPVLIVYLFSNDLIDKSVVAGALK